MQPVLVDTSVLARLLERDSPNGRAAEKAVSTPGIHGGELAVCPQVLVVFWVVATRPRDTNGYGLKPADADACIGDFLDAFTLLPDPSDLLERWRQLVVKHAVCGKLAHDARLAAALRAHNGTRILTFNPRDFKRFDLEVVTPALDH